MHVRFCRDVSNDAYGDSSRRPNRVNRLVDVRLRAGDDGDLAALTREHLRRVAPHAPTATREEDDLARDPEIHVPASFPRLDDSVKIYDVSPASPFGSAP